MKKIAIIGATSAIAAETAKLWAAEGAEFFLVARDQQKLTLVADDLKVRGAKEAHIYLLDLQDTYSYESMVTACYAALVEVQVLLVAHGTLPNQADCEVNPEYAAQQFLFNSSTTINLLLRFAQYFERQSYGTIAVISSVAGDRGRPSNYLYGSAKGAVSIFCEGMRSRLAKRGVNLLLIKPGMVNTPMTAGLSLPKILVAEPESVAQSIYLAIARGRTEIYAPGYWFFIMLVIKSIPNFIYKKLSF